MSSQTAEKLIVGGLVVSLLAGCGPAKPMFPQIEAKAAKICIDAGLVPDSHGRPYRCYISDDDARLK